MKRKYAIGIAICLLSVFETRAETEGVQLPDKASCAALSPQDGSLWIGTAGNGLMRTGRNGRTLTYDAARFGAPIDTVKALWFGPDGTLLMENSAGQRFHYTSAGGFVEEPVVGETPQEEQVVVIKKEEEPEPARKPAIPWWIWAVLCAIAGAIGGYFGGRTRKPEPAEIKTPVQEPQNAPKIEEETPDEPTVAPETEKPVEPVKTPEKKPAPEVVVVDRVFCEKVLSMIEAHLADPEFNVEAMAQEMGISRIHVNRKMKEAMGTSPSVLINKTRMERAAAMLKEGGYSIADVGRAVGFDTPSYFSSAFRRYYGKTPKEFQEIK